MINKGIILAGGTGSRLNPITKATNKQLLPLYDKPLIFYPLSSLMLANIKNIQIIVNQGSIPEFYKLLGDGSLFGIKITYKEQLKPLGIPEAFKICEKFIGNSNIALILGDNFFYGRGLGGILEQSKSFKNGCKIFIKDVQKPENYGVAKLKNNKILLVKEKPKKFISSKAITGLYFFDNLSVKYAKTLNPSKRGETEIIDVIKKYLKSKKLEFSELGRGTIWSDVGKIDDLHNVGNFVASSQKLQGEKIACLEEIAFKKGWLTKKQIFNIIKKSSTNPYSIYLKKILN